MYAPTLNNSHILDSKRRLQLVQLRKHRHFTCNYEKNWKLAPLPDPTSDARFDKHVGKIAQTQVNSSMNKPMGNVVEENSKKQSQTISTCDDTKSNEGEKCVCALLALIASAKLCYIQEQLRT